MQAQEEKDEDLKRLLPCPFCGGGITEFHDNSRVWVGMTYSDPISVSVRHWCEEAPGPSRMVERIGRDKEQAIERWNMRSNVKLTGDGERSLPASSERSERRLTAGLERCQQRRNDMKTLGQIAFEAWNGGPQSDDEWPAGDRIVKRWEKVAATVAAAEREACAKECDEAAAKTDISSKCFLRDAYKGMAKMLRSNVK